MALKFLTYLNFTTPDHNVDSLKGIVESMTDVGNMSYMPVETGKGKMYLKARDTELLELSDEDADDLFSFLLTITGVKSNLWKTPKPKPEHGFYPLYTRRHTPLTTDECQSVYDDFINHYDMARKHLEANRKKPTNCFTRIMSMFSVDYNLVLFNHYKILMETFKKGATGEGVIVIK